jgi:hypothetical protein
MRLSSPANLSSSGQPGAVSDFGSSQRSAIPVGRGSCRAARFRSAVARQEPRPPRLTIIRDYTLVNRRSVPEDYLGTPGACQMRIVPSCNAASGNVPEGHGFVITPDSQSAAVRRKGQRSGWLRISRDAECPRMKAQRRCSLRTLETDR